MGNITLVGRLQDYAGKAIDSFYKTAGRIASPIIDTVASIDFAGSYFNNSAIPEYMKFQALHRNFLRNESAIAQIGGGEFPAPGKKMELGWKDFWKIAAAVGVLSAAGTSYAYMKKKDIGMDDIDSGLAYAKHEIFSSSLFSFMNEPPVADLKIDTPQKDWISGNKIVFNASNSSDDKGIVKYEWNVDGEKIITSEPRLEQSFKEGNHLVDLKVYDKEGKSAQMGVGVEVKRPYDYYDKDLKVGVWIEGDEQLQKNVKNMLAVMKEKTPERYREAIEIYNLKPKTIVRSNEKYSYNSENEIGLSDGVVASGGSDIKNVLGADESLYGEMMGEAPRFCKASQFDNCKLPRNGYEAELYQHSNAVKYGVDTGIITKEEANEFLKKGGWFYNAAGRYPTPEDMEGVDIKRFLIK